MQRRTFLFTALVGGGLTRKHVCRSEAVYPPHVHSAFPLMHLPPQDY